LYSISLSASCDPPLPAPAGALVDAPVDAGVDGAVEDDEDEEDPQALINAAADMHAIEARSRMSFQTPGSVRSFPR
jgi:hypothetical protein